MKICYSCYSLQSIRFIVNFKGKSISIIELLFSHSFIISEHLSSDEFISIKPNFFTAISYSQPHIFWLSIFLSKFDSLKFKSVIVMLNMLISIALSCAQVTSLTINDSYSLFIDWNSTKFIVCFDYFLDFTQTLQLIQGSIIQNLMIVVKKQFIFKLIIILIVSLSVNSHQVQQIRKDSQEIINAFVNQAKSIIIPFKTCLKVEPELQANEEFIEFKPNKVSLTSLLSYSIKKQGSKISVLEDLRNPAVFKHRDIIIFDSFLMVMFTPNIILIVQEKSDKFVLKSQYKIDKLEPLDQFKMYKLQDKAILVIYNKNKIFLLNQNDYQQYQLPGISSIFHIQELGPSYEFYAAQNRLGLTHYKLNPASKKIQIVNRLNGNSLELPDDFKSIVDVNLKLMKEKKKIYVLDFQRGIIQIDIVGEQKLVGKVVVDQKNCESFDMVNQENFVLLCRNQGHTTIIQAHRYFDKRSNSFKYKKVEPIFQANYYNDLHVTQDYYILYSYKALQYFWNARKNRLTYSLQSQGQIMLPGLETFTLKQQKNQNFLYTVQSGQLKKYLLQQQKATLKLKSNRALNKKFKLYLYGNCNDLNNEFDQDNVDSCKVIKDVQFNVMEEQEPRQKDYSISFVIISILITVFLLLIWICLNKYKGLERQARILLETYQKKKNKKSRI